MNELYRPMRKTLFFAGIAFACLVFTNTAQAQVFFSEDFEGVTTPALPAGWATTNPSGGDAFFTGDNTDANSAGYWPVAPHTTFAMANDDACNCVMAEVRLILPPQDLTSYTNVDLTAEVWGDDVYGGAYRVEASTDSGTTWTPVGADFPLLAAWQVITRDLTAYAGMSNVWVAFRYDDQGGWATGLAVDDVELSEPASSADAAITIAERLDVEYTIVPMDHLRPVNLNATIENIGTQDLTNVVLHSDVYDITDLNTAVLSATSTGAALNAGMSMTVNNNMSNMMLSSMGTFVARHYVTHDDVDSDSANDTLWTNQFEVSDMIFARDDTMSTDNGGFGIGTGAGNNALIGQVFELQVDVLVDMIEVTLDEPAAAEPVSAVIYACDAMGVPMGTAIDTTGVMVTVGAGGDETFMLTFASPIPLSAGKYLFAVQEEGTGNIGVKGWTAIYTPGDNTQGTNWVAWDGNPNGAGVWTEPTTLVAAFATAYAIRPYMTTSVGIIAPATAGSMHVYPNPTDDGQLNVLLSDMGNDAYTLEFIDAAGKVVQRIVDLNDQGVRQVDLGDVRPGIYTIRAYNENTSITQRVIRK